MTFAEKNVKDIEKKIKTYKYFTKQVFPGISKYKNDFLENQLELWKKQVEKEKKIIDYINNENYKEDNICVGNLIPILEILEDIKE